MYVWNAEAVDGIILALPDEGADPLDDCEYVDRTLNAVFQGTAVHDLVKDMRRGSCGALGIIEGLAFFADKRGLGLEQFEVKLLKLFKALQKCQSKPSSPSLHNAPTVLHLPRPAVPMARAPSAGSSSRVSLHKAQPAQYDSGLDKEISLPDMDDDSSSDIEDGKDDWDDEDSADETRMNGTDKDAPPRKPYERGPIPNDLRDSVAELCKAFNDTLQELADKSNRPLHQVQRLANLNTVVPLRRSPNAFNGYARKRKIDGLPKGMFRIVLIYALF